MKLLDKTAGVYLPGSIYALCDSKNRVPFYIGETHKPLDEYVKSHRGRVGKDARLVYTSIAAQFGKDYDKWFIIELAQYGSEGPTDLEHSWVLDILSSGIELTNMKKGSIIEDHAEMLRRGVTTYSELKLARDIEAEQKTQAAANAKHAKWLLDEADRVAKLLQDEKDLAAKLLQDEADRVAKLLQDEKDLAFYAANKKEKDAFVFNSLRKSVDVKNYMMHFSNIRYTKTTALRTEMLLLKSYRYGIEYSKFWNSSYQMTEQDKTVLLDNINTFDKCITIIEKVIADRCEWSRSQTREWSRSQTRESPAERSAFEILKKKYLKETK